MAFIEMDGEMIDVDHPETQFVDSDSFSIEGISVIGVTDDGFMLYINSEDPVTIPHYHYRDVEWRDFHCCLRLNKPEYCKHGGRQDRLSDEQKANLVAFLSGSRE